MKKAMLLLLSTLLLCLVLSAFVRGKPRVECEYTTTWYSSGYYGGLIPPECENFRFLFRWNNPAKHARYTVFCCEDA